MKMLRWISVTSCLFLALTPLCANAGEVAEWRAGRATTSTGGLLLPDARGGFDLVLENAAGVKIGGKPTVGKDTKSIEFSGSQLAPFKTSRPFPSLGGKSKISLAFKPADVAPADDGTILRYGTQWELRYSAKLGKLSFIIWDVEKNFTIATVVADAGSWHEAEATFDGSTMRLEVGGQVDEKPVVAAIFVEPREPNLVLGASRPNTTGEAGIDIRPFAGSVADIQISD